MADMKLVIEIGEDGISTEKYIPLSQAEIAQRELDAIAYAEAEAVREAEAEAAAEAKAAVVAKALELGLTEEEIASLTA